NQCCPIFLLPDGCSFRARFVSATIVDFVPPTALSHLIGPTKRENHSTGRGNTMDPTVTGRRLSGFRQFHARIVGNGSIFKTRVMSWPNNRPELTHQPPKTSEQAPRLRALERPRSPLIPAPGNRLRT